MAGALPIVAQGRLRWPADSGAGEIAVDSVAWLRWLNDPATRSFSYTDAAGAVTVRKERRQRGSDYWVAYARRAGRLHKRYLGRAERVTGARLAEVAAAWNAVTVAPDRPTAAARRVPARPSGQGLATGAWSLLVTKLQPPLPRSSLVARPSLLRQLDRAAQRRLTVVAAPAGAGKTSLLSAWATRRHRIAWLSLDAADAEPARFWRYVLAALARARPGLDDDAGALLRSPSPVPLTTALTVLVNALAALPHDLVLVLDDYQVIAADAVPESLAWLLDHAPANFHLVVAARGTPDLPLARLRARGLVAEIDATALRLTPEEAAKLLRRGFGLTLPPAMVAELTERTDGWAAGLYLAGLALRDRSTTADALTALGHDRALRDYLLTEVVQRQPSAVRDFLLDTIMLDPVSGPLCDAVTGRSDGAVMLERLERANLFLAPLDPERRWYRYLPLVADALRIHLAQTDAGRLRERHHRAAAWYATHDGVDEAIGHALAAGDDATAAGYLEAALERLLHRADAGVVLRWARALPAPQVLRRPRLCIGVAWALLAIGQFAAIDHWVAAAEAGLHGTAGAGDERPDGSSVPALLAQIDALRATVAVHGRDADRAIVLARRALDHLPSTDTVVRAMVAHDLGDAHLLRGEVDAASRAFAEAIAVSRQAGTTIITVSAAGSLGELQANQGRLHAAADTLRQAIAAATGPDGSLRPWAGKPQVWLAGLLYEWNALDSAAALVMTAIERCRAWGHQDHEFDGHLLLAAIRAAGKQHEAALAALDAAAALLTPADALNLTDRQTWLADRLTARRVDVCLLAGDLAAALAWWQARPPGRQGSESGALSMAHARLLIAQGRPDQAARQLARSLDAATAPGRQRRLIGLLAVQALAWSVAGRPGLALDTVARALTLAEPEGYVRTWLDLGAPMVDLLHLALAHDVTPDYLRQVLAAAAADPAPGIQPPAGGPRAALALPVAPSARELDVLRLLAAGRSNAEIAAALFVSINTVKTHLRRLYAKLDAGNRVAALATARRDGWI
ncbi:MAG: hypothetical protein IT340_07600 [Chloroflexi bacterium]|nr:hypothetical protein [Chloroflexota bacterium]